MPRAAAPLLQTEVARAVTTPGYLVEIGFTINPPLRFCSRDTVYFRGNAFLNWGFDLQGLSSGTDRAGVRGTLTVADPDKTLATYILNEGIEDKAVRVWAYYGDVPAMTAVDLWSPVELFTGLASGCTIDPGRGRVTVSLFSSASLVKFSPRLRITKANGFNWLPARGKIIEFGGERFEIEPE